MMRSKCTDFKIMELQQNRPNRNDVVISEGSIRELDHILGERVKVKGKDGQDHYGILQFVGTNESFPKKGLMVTISRQPLIQINSIMDIEILEEK